MSPFWCLSACCPLLWSFLLPIIVLLLFLDDNPLAVEHQAIPIIRLAKDSFVLFYKTLWKTQTNFCANPILQKLHLFKKACGICDSGTSLQALWAIYIYIWPLICIYINTHTPPWTTDWALKGNIYSQDPATNQVGLFIHHLYSLSAKWEYFTRWLLTSKFNTGTFF